tara:strand:+ start:8145 stop:8441 length:297 start_codon:yes stop_codon:yes gene_type:complete
MLRNIANIFVIGKLNNGFKTKIFQRYLTENLKSNEIIKNVKHKDADYKDADDEDADYENMFVKTTFNNTEWGGPLRGGTLPEPTRFGDWERKGRCTDY